MESTKYPECDPDPENNPVKASPANDYQSNAGFVYLVKKNTFNWNLLVQESSPVSHCSCGRKKPLDLEHSTRKRIMKMAEKEETFMNPKRAQKKSAILRE